MKPSFVKPPYPLNNEKGMSLILVSLVTGLTFALLATALISQSQNAVSTIKSKYREGIDFQTLTGEINMVMGNRPGCVANLKNLRVVPGRVLSDLTINYAGLGATTSLLAKKESSFNHLVVQDIQLEYAKAMPAGYDLANLVVKAEGIKNATSHSFSLKIPVMFSKSAGGAIQDCQTTTYVDDQTLFHDQLCSSRGVQKVYDFIADKCI